jgi:hypothetical protein
MNIERESIFETELGRQSDVIYVTSDNHFFIRHEDAEAHVKQAVKNNKMFDRTITPCFRLKENKKIERKDVPTEEQVLQTIFDSVFIRGIELEDYKTNFSNEKSGLYDAIVKLFDDSRTSSGS